MDRYQKYFYPVSAAESLLGTNHASFESRRVSRESSEAEKLSNPIFTRQIPALLSKVHFTGFCEDKILKSNIRYRI